MASGITFRSADKSQESRYIPFPEDAAEIEIDGTSSVAIKVNGVTIATANPTGLSTTLVPSAADMLSTAIAAGTATDPGEIPSVETGGLADPAKVNNAFATVAVQLNAVRAALQASGIMVTP